MRLVVLFDMLVNPSLKMMTSFANIARTTSSMSKWHSDDILAAFDNEQDSLNFVNFLNNRHPNIKIYDRKTN